MKRHGHMDYYETPSGQRLTLAVGHDMVRLNHALDALRTLAYREGVPKLFTDEEPVRVGPWENRHHLLCELAGGAARMDALRRQRALPIIPEDLRNRAELLYYDICHHGTALQQHGYIEADEHPRHLATQHYKLDTTVENIQAAYDKPEFQKPLPEIDARGAAVSSPGRNHFIS